MQVVATAGHVDHGKSTLVRALTGMEPDRWDEERRRGLTLDLGYAWMTLPRGEQLAFVDVPGHERFVPTMLAGVGPVAAVMFVVAADEGWMPQSEEHLAAVDALRIRHGLLVVTRADLADPAPALRVAGERIARTTLGAIPALAVSAVTGAGLPALTGALDDLAGRLPSPDPEAPVRIWVDRAFSIRGSGTVVTGTLPAGTVRVRDELELTPGLRQVRVRGIQTLREATAEVSGVARVALNIRGADAGSIRRGMALVSPGGWTLTQVVDVRLGFAAPAQPESGSLCAETAAMTAVSAHKLDGGPVSAQGAVAWPRELTLHVGAARVLARLRMLDARHARLTLREALWLHVGDRLLLRLPGAARGASAQTHRLRPPVVGATVLDVLAPVLRGRGAARAAGQALQEWPEPPAAADLLRRHGLLRLPTLRAMGFTACPEPVCGDWLADPAHWEALGARLADVVRGHASRDPLAAGMPLEAARAALGLPDRRLVLALARESFITSEGLLRAPGSTGTTLATQPTGGLMDAVRAVRGDLSGAPFRAPEAGRLRELGIDTKVIAAAARQGLLLRLSDHIVLDAGADAAAARHLAGLPQPFTTAQARQALGTTRRVVVPLLEHLDRAGYTERLPDDRRRVRPAHPPGR